VLGTLPGFTYNFTTQIKDPIDQTSVFPPLQQQANLHHNIISLRELYQWQKAKPPPLWTAIPAMGCRRPQQQEPPPRHRANTGQHPHRHERGTEEQHVTPTLTSMTITTTFTATITASAKIFF